MDEVTRIDACIMGLGELDGLVGHNHRANDPRRLSAEPNRWPALTLPSANNQIMETTIFIYRYKYRFSFISINYSCCTKLKFRVRELMDPYNTLCTCFAYVSRFIIIHLNIDIKTKS